MLIEFCGGPKDGLVREKHNPGSVLWINRREYEHDISAREREFYVPYRRIEKIGERIVYLYAGHNEAVCANCDVYHVRAVEAVCKLCGRALTAL